MLPLFQMIQHIIIMIIFIIADLLKNWSFVFLIIIVLFYKQIKELISNLNILKLTKDGLELQKAKETINDLQELAVTMYIPVLDMLAKTGRWDSTPTIEERLLNRDMVQKFTEKHHINDYKVKEKIDGIDNSILLDVLCSMVDNLNGTNKSNIYDEIHQLFNICSVGNFTCKPNMPAIKDKLIENGLMDDEVKYIYEEAENFITTKQFKNISKLKHAMNLKSKYHNW